MRSIGTAVIVVSALAASVTAEARPGARTARASGGAAPKPYEAATVDLDHDAAHVVVVADGVALVTRWSSPTWVAVGDPRTGATVRARSLAGDCRGVAVDDRGARLLFAACERELVAIDPGTLAERWRVALGGYPSTLDAIAARADLVLVPVYVPEPGITGRGVMWLVALDVGGRERWRLALPDVNVAVRDGGDAVHVITRGAATRLTAIERATGATRWTRAIDGSDAEVVDVDRATLALAGRAGVVLVDAATGAERRRVIDGPVWKLAVAGDWLLTIEPGDWPDGPTGRLHGRNLATGARWTYAPEVWAGALTVVDDVVIASRDTGVLHAVEVATGVSRWWADTGFGRDVAVIDAHRLVTIRENSAIVIETDRASAAPIVIVRGRFVEACGARRGQRVWIGNRMVRTDRGGRFRARVRGGARITVTADPRDTRSDVGPVVRVAGEDLHVELTTYKGGCY